jgi:thiosulfate reductase cytochrome b subunit
MQTHFTSIHDRAETFAVIHPVWLRIIHWLNVLAVILMVTSGWRIYNAAPFWPISFPNDWTLGGWLGGALQWHFAGMWILVINGLLYVSLNLGTGRYRRKFLPLTPSVVLSDFKAALRGRLSHADLSHYNGLQKAAYLFAVLDLAVLVVSGLVLWKSVQFSVLRDLLGGYDTARRVHFIAMGVLLTFVAGHVFMVALVPRTLLTMIRGR